MSVTYVACKLGPEPKLPGSDNDNSEGRAEPATPQQPTAEPKPGRREPPAGFSPGSPWRNCAYYYPGATPPCYDSDGLATPYE